MRTSVDVSCASAFGFRFSLARVDYPACSKGRSFARMPVLAQGMQCLSAFPAAGGRHQGATLVPKACGPCVPGRPQTRGFFSRPALLGRPKPGLQLRVAASRRRTLACVAVAAPAAPAVAATGAAYSTLSLGFPKETYHEEKRAAATPETVARLVKAGFGAVLVETGLGVGSGFADSAYSAAGAHLSAACALPAGLRCAARLVGLASGR
jgi:Alanine dehydrogenase/PNT, N-terminal domain